MIRVALLKVEMTVIYSEMCNKMLKFNVISSLIHKIILNNHP